MINQLFTYTLEVDPSGFKYHLFYQLAILAAFLVFLYYGYRKKYPIAKWILLSTTVTFCSILGSKLGTYGFVEWQQVWEGDALLPNTNRTSIGALILALVSIWGAIRILRLPAASFEVYAFVIPVVMIFQRVACLLGSCCFGKPTNGAWGIRYEGVSLIRDHHINSGLVTQYDPTSFLVHPVPVYFILAAIITLLIIFKMRHRIKAVGNLTMLSIGIALLFRFIIEFFRDGITNHQLGEFYYGLKGVQWVLLVGVLLFFITVVWREIKFTSGIPKSKPNSNQLFPVVCFATILSLLILVSKNVFTPVEIGVMHAKLTLAWLAIGYMLIYQFRLRSIRWQASFMALLSFAMMSQTYPENANDLTGTKEISITAGFNELDTKITQYDCIATEQGCGGTYCSQYDIDNPYGPKYYSGKLGIDVIDYYEYSKKRHYKYSRYGVDYQPEFFYNEELDHLEKKYSVMPYFGFGNTKRFETKIGLRIGDFLGNDFDDLNNDKKLMLAFSQRFGNLNGFHVNISWLNAPDLGPSVNGSHISLAYNFNSINSGPLNQITLGRSGIYESSNESASTLYMETTFLLEDHWIISPKFGVIGLPSGQDVTPHFYYGLTAGYRFNTKKKMDRNNKE